MAKKSGTAGKKTTNTTRKVGNSNINSQKGKILVYKPRSKRKSTRTVDLAGTINTTKPREPDNETVASDNSQNSDAQSTKGDQGITDPPVDSAFRMDKSIDPPDPTKPTNESTEPNQMIESTCEKNTEAKLDDGLLVSLKNVATDSPVAKNDPPKPTNSTDQSTEPNQTIESTREKKTEAKLVLAD